ncbi:hypothetical protein A2348_05275 [Candidatus Uhrbacteria bacterium RIFOXYB12_FULL_58_10]|uniref:DUF2938 domain-containing protein n=1 Tax=Candidatus Uhrbacteria bacterium RIFOXYB2_FULL_57_15 TaxID=1802422 RepID=A0A1F7W4M6_9BACT|nr:MAG: hypothetical protein A2348_05275 [Candidatus Uhrbacteria bacterium RIFOXYB12_FULL_58_10]OGL97709.1 MAG: hypothetical protein A2304_00395 [Candidatus Uhrbacteria bacterium RIFOXYB2_FULL_57_15]OGM00036.1 MAG: hypothetical protein A2501_03740 [Candidatus Uhrbacteria bacterium RIFOXYC12_FULL_57_11]
MDYLLGTSIGGLTALFFAIPAIVLEAVERWRVPNAPLLVDIKTLWGRKLDRHETFLVALLVHLVVGSLFGLMYVVFVKKGWLFVTHSPYTFLSLVVFAVGSWVVSGLTIFPALGMGPFGRRAGHRVWLEMLASHLLVGFGMWLVVQYYQPIWFID